MSAKTEKAKEQAKQTKNVALKGEEDSESQSEEGMDHVKEKQGEDEYEDCSPTKVRNLIIRKRRRIDGNGGSRPCYCFYEDYDREFLESISEKTKEKMKQEQEQFHEFYYLGGDVNYGYIALDIHRFGYCPCCSVCKCWGKLIEKNTDMQMMQFTGGSGSSCCGGVCDSSDTCCKMGIDGLFDLICLPFKILMECYKFLCKAVCGSCLNGNAQLLANTPCDNCMQGAFRMCSGCYQGFMRIICRVLQFITYPCRVVCNAMCQTPLCIAITGVLGRLFTSLINLLSVPLQALVHLCSACCAKVIVPVLELIVKFCEVLCNVFRIF